MYYHICEYCGAALDPNEVCDCIEEMEKAESEQAKKESALQMNGILQNTFFR